MGYVIKGLVSDLTPAEKWFLVTHPHLIGIIRDNAGKASSESRRRFAGPGEHNGKGDAFRHCYWSALLARDIGKDNATAFTTAHEGFSDNPAGERAMDLHNNAVGVSIGEAFVTSSDRAISDQCAAALGLGMLMTAPPSPGAAYGY